MHLLAADSISIKLGDFSYGLLKVTENKLLDILIDHIHIVNKPIYMSGSLICLCQETLLEEFCTNVTVENIHFSDHQRFN